MAAFVRKLIQHSNFCTTLESVSKSSYVSWRTFLSSSYGCQERTLELTSSAKDAPEMALQTLAMDRCHERDMPISSLMIDRMVRAIQSNQHLNGSLYYLFKFRHTQNGYYLHPWTTFTFVKKCLDINHEVLIEALKEKTQYGVFPNEISLNLALDHFLKNRDLNGAVTIASEMFLLETLHNETTQALAIQAISRYWSEKIDDGKLVPMFDETVVKRNLSAIIYCVGLYISNPSLTLIGQSLLGSIEAEHGIRAVYQDPWGPLSWEPGYLQRAVENVENLDKTMSQQAADILLECTSGDDELHTRAQCACREARERDLISTDEQFSLHGIAENLAANLPKFEEKDKELLNNDLSLWLADRNTLEDIESEILENYSNERAAHFRALDIEEKSHKMAVEELGYWDMEKKRMQQENPKPDEKPIFYLCEDYVDGALDDLELAEKFRDAKEIIKEPVILIN